MMVGRELSSFYSQAQRKFPQSGAGSAGPGQRRVFHDINFQLRKGEILGFTGLVGSGRTEVMEAIFGIRSFDRGEILLRGTGRDQEAPQTPLPQAWLWCRDRKAHGLILKNTVGFNMTITVLKEFIGSFRVDRKAERSILDSYKERLRIVTPSYRRIAAKLSGGNQQKVVLAKWLATNPWFSSWMNPPGASTWGPKRRSTRSCTISPSRGFHHHGLLELPEVMAMSDRICVMNEGTISATLAKGILRGENRCLFC